MAGHSFDVIALASAAWRHPGPAVAAARAGGVGILDLGFCHDAKTAQASFNKLLAGTSGRVGLRVTATTQDMAESLLDSAGDRLLIVLLDSVCATDAEAAQRFAGAHRALWAEIDSSEELSALNESFDALVARGHECGGWVGTDTSYILLQKLAAATDRPVYVHGGIGTHTAAAVRVAGAAGVVLGDQLLLMPESPLSDALKDELGRLNGSETRLIGELLGMPCRVHTRPSSAQLTEADALTRQVEASELDIAEWRQQIQAMTGWHSSELLRPIGQDIGLAKGLARRFSSTGRLVQAIDGLTAQAIDLANETRHLAPDSPLAEAHGTQYPLAQGPMTRVSDSPDFAKAVSANGALPFLALALMRGKQVDELLAETADKMGDLPWGVGLLGFVPQQLREEQIAAIWKYKPPFALIAGGRPDQAAEFENRGIPTYIHAPAPALLRMYLEQGAKRFVFEGRECGGHIGPIASFPLWEQMIDVLLTDVPEKQAADIHVLFAGGVHDGLSGAMLAALTAPLAKRGMKVGALMGSAYLFTDEIVDTGATVAGYREQALACERTVSLETGPGHATRCSDTQFAHDFYERRRELLREGADHESIRDELEGLNLGRLRMASKGRMRDAEGTLNDYDAEAQVRDGMYMIGQVATLNRSVFTLRDLHERVANGAQDVLSRWRQPEVEPTIEAAPCDVAIVGIGTVLPGADNAEAYWDNVLQGRSVITEIPRHRFDWELYYDPDPSARDKIYSKWGGFIPETVFDPFKFGIPPMSMKYIDPMQLLSLEVCSRAIADAGFVDGNFDREHTSVILGAGGGLGDIGMQYGVRSELTRFVEDPDDGVWDRLPEWGQESFSGSLLNVAAGRVANRLDLGGVNFTVDAACGSSLAAITLATQELESGRSNIVLAGGIDTVNSPFGYMCFSKTNALSPTGTPRTFDRSANGIVISEGAAVIVLKRLADAERDGDRIYSVIKAAAGSSDGRALGMTAPRPEGQMRALTRAYAKAGFSPGDIDMLEAHGTGTAVGDRAEAETITRVLREAGVDERRVALGSVKSILGHTKCAAGVSGLIKTALSLYHRTLPMHVGVDDPIEPISVEDSPVYVPSTPKPWLTRAGRPRRGAVSAFGFGGTNFHVVLEEYRDEFTSDEVPGARHWPSELCLVRAADRDAMVGEIDRLIAALADDPDVTLSELAYGLATEAAKQAASPVALAIVTSDLETLASDLAAAKAHIVDGKPLMPHIQFSDQVPAEAPKTAFLFPGQGSQYVDMGREPGVYLDDIRSAMELADQVLAADIEPALSRIVWPESLYNEQGEAAQKQRLTDTRHAQPALGALEIGYLRLARRLGLSAQASAGHSYGEYGALLAAGVIDESTLLSLSATRGRAMAEAGDAGTPGGMAAVRTTRSKVNEHLEAFASVKVANHNAPQETVISGPKEDVEAAVKQLADAGIEATLLPVSGAFHTELVGAAQEPLSKAIAEASFNAPQHAVYSNTLGSIYPEAPEEIRQLLDRHMLSTVEFVEQMRAMYADGVRLFVELGPKSVVSRMASATLAEHKDVHYVALDQRKGTLAGLLGGLGALALAGADFRLTELFAARRITACDRRLLAQKRKETPPKTAWMLSGGCARPIDDPVLRTGKERPLDKQEKEQAQDKARTARQAQTQAPARPTPAAMPAQPAPQPSAAQSAAPAAAQAPSAPPAGSDQALTAYHDTMRQFLALQERVMSQFLGQGQGIGQGQSHNQGAAQGTGYPAAAPASGMPTASAQPATPQAPAAAAPAAPTQPAAEARPSAPAAEQAAPAEQVDSRGLLLATVSELTGYPEDMIEADADLEADLGIDSIKRVEILGAFRKQLPQATSEAMQANMEAFTGAKSMTAVLAELDKLPGAAPSAQAAAAQSAPAQAETSVDHRGLLMSTVSELTGYPEDMIEADADLEADLGIDSIKRVEILGAFRKQLPQATSEAMQANMEAFTGAKSVTGVLAELEKLPGGASTTAAMDDQAAAAVAPAETSFDGRALLLSTVAELTGYPEDMIDADADLEADLGIDSIKRVEILGAFRKQLPQATSEAMQANMEAFTGAKSVTGVLAELDKLPNATPLAAAAPESAQSGAAQAPAATGNQMTAAQAKPLLLATVAELTGYPEDMIDENADLEADLGIDSIKRVEILGAFRKQMPEDIAQAMQAKMEAFTGAKTVSAITEQVEAVTQGDPSAPAAAAAESAQPATASTDSAPQASQAPEDMPRFVIRSKSKPLSGESISPEGLIIVAGPAGETRDTLIQQLGDAGAQTAVVDAIDAQSIESAVADARDAHGAVHGLVHLHGLAPSQADQLSDWQADGQRCVLSLFHAIKALGEDIAKARVIAASRLGGSLSRETEAGGSPLAGGAAGLLKCVGHEYPESVVRLVDFNGQSDASIAHRLFDEYTHQDGATECGYTGDARHGAVTVAAPLNDSAFSPQIVPESGWVALATGGARGITADILGAWVVPGMTLVLAGRSPEPDAEDPALADAKDEAAIKRVLLEQSREAGEKIKPVELEARARRVQGAREIRQNLAALREAGASVEYHAVDVRDEASFGGLIDDVYARHGRLDAVIHGAGVIEDKLLADKTAESFERVFSTKVDSAWILAQHLQADSLKALCFFTSVAGRYGNPGQGDYAAANEAVARLAWQLSRRFTEARVLAINWGPWDAGMVTEGIKRQFRERGLEAIPVAQGVGYFGRELALGAKGDVELVAGQGPWAFEQAQAQQSDEQSGLPLVRAKLRMGIGGALVLDHRLDIESDPYLLDHVMDDTPVLPATGALEWMAEAVAAGWPDWQVAEVRGLRVLSGVRLDASEPVDIEISARASTHSGLGDQMIDVDIKQPGRKASCYRASVRLVSRLEEPPVFEGSAPLSGEAIDLDKAYTHYLFHGPRFQLLDSIQVTEADGVDARVTPSALAKWVAEPKSGWLFDPGMLDCGPQMAVVWSRRYHDTTALPSSFGSVKRYGHEPLPASLRAVCRLQDGSDGNSLRYDVSFIDDDNRVRVEMRDVSGTGTTALNRLTSGRFQ